MDVSIENSSVCRAGNNVHIEPTALSRNPLFAVLAPKSCQMTTT